ncbi:Hypothetical predicted protein [Olea europaea subsp. europaea]|uniref:Uncharacterized protein n=1 Tax=Olea europaea subsp. europaea TaxID=158383 RepID=A0A8S0R247_OLEEU|nr:Hypothetical predicted protein [Olea europaea subsp. europaea]
MPTTMRAFYIVEFEVDLRDEASLFYVVEFEGCSYQTFGGAIEERGTHVLIVAVDSKFNCAPFHFNGLDHDPNYGRDRLAHQSNCEKVVEQAFHYRSGHDGGGTRHIGSFARLLRECPNGQEEAPKSELGVRAKEEANKEKAELKAKVEGLVDEAAGLKQQLERAGGAAIEEYVAHFHETSEYDGLGMYWRGLAYSEFFKRLAELHPELDFTSIRDDFIPTEPSTLADKEVPGREDVD